MARRPKAKPKRKSPKDTKGSDEKQSARFVETARLLETDESGGEFGRALAKIFGKSPSRKSRQ
jgi:hypothetical protein